MLQLGIVSGARQMITVGQGFLPVIVGVTDSSAPPNSVLGAGVIFQSFVLRPEADTVIDSGGEAGSGHGMPVILSSSQAIVISDSNGLASLVPSPNSILGAVEIDMIATAGTAATQQFIARSFWPVPTARCWRGSTSTAADWSRREESNATPEVRMFQTAASGGKFCASDLRTLKLSLLRPLVYPGVHRLVPQSAVLRLEHPVSFIRKIQHF